MDDNNYMNNDNRSSGTPDNTGVFGQPSGTANGSDTYSQRQTHIISLYPSRKVGMHMDSHQTRQAAQTDMSIIRAVHMVMQIRYIQSESKCPGCIQSESKCPGYIQPEHI